MRTGLRLGTTEPEKRRSMVYDYPGAPDHDPVINDESELPKLQSSLGRCILFAQNDNAEPAEQVMVKGDVIDMEIPALATECNRI